MLWVSRLSSYCRSKMRRSFPLETLDIIMPEAGCCIAVGLEYRCTGVGSPVHLGLRLSWIACTACYNNIVQLGCRLIACWLCRPPWCGCQTPTCMPYGPRLCPTRRMILSCQWQQGCMGALQQHCGGDRGVQGDLPAVTPQDN